MIQTDAIYTVGFSRRVGTDVSQFQRVYDTSRQRCW
jgi:hypothetical protein